MPNMTDIKQLVTDLHDRKIVNAGTTLAELVALQANHVTPGETAGWYVAGGEHYVIVCGMTAGADKIKLPGGGNPFGK